MFLKSLKLHRFILNNIKAVNIYIFWLMRFRLALPHEFFFKNFLAILCDRGKNFHEKFSRRRASLSKCRTLSPNAFVKSTIYHFRFPPGGGGAEDLEEGSRRRRSRAWPGGTGSWNNRVFAPRPSPVENGSTLGWLHLVEFCENPIVQ